MIKYVVGFLFDESLSLVVLIEKQTPAWQKLKWNGVGGKIEPGETPLQAMIREFHEEAGVEIDKWNYFCKINGQNSEIFFFYSIVNTEKLMSVKTMTKEKLGIWSLTRVTMENFPLLPNIRWILPMSLVKIKESPHEIYEISINHGTK